MPTLFADLMLKIAASNPYGIETGRGGFRSPTGPGPAPSPSFGRPVAPKRPAVAARPQAAPAAPKGPGFFSRLQSAGQRMPQQQKSMATAGRLASPSNSQAKMRAKMRPAADRYMKYDHAADVKERLRQRRIVRATNRRVPQQARILGEMAHGQKQVAARPLRQAQTNQKHDARDNSQVRIESAQQAKRTSVGSSSRGRAAAAQAQKGKAQRLAAAVRPAEAKGYKKASDELLERALLLQQLLSEL